MSLQLIPGFSKTVKTSQSRVPSNEWYLNLCQSENIISQSPYDGDVDVRCEQRNSWQNLHGRLSLRQSYMNNARVTRRVWSESGHFNALHRREELNTGPPQCLPVL